MTEEQKQALIVQIRNYLQAVDNNSTMFTPVSVFHDMARVALAALTTDQAEPVPEGWKLVPVEPTAEMLDSQEHEMLPMVHHDSMRERARMIRRHGWRVMLAAAPEVK